MIDQQPMTVVSLTDAAVGKLTELTKEETNPAIGLRVYVYSGGCSGFRYGMMRFEDAPTPEDRILDVSGIKVYGVDGQSVDLPGWPQIDYVDTLMGAGFTVNNPNARGGVWMRPSFRTADDGGAPKGCRTDPTAADWRAHDRIGAAGRSAASLFVGPPRCPDLWGVRIGAFDRTRLGLDGRLGHPWSRSNCEGKVDGDPPLPAAHRPLPRHRPAPPHLLRDRYRALTRHCLATGTPFGVVLIRDGHEAGTRSGRSTSPLSGRSSRSERPDDIQMDAMTLRAAAIGLFAIDYGRSKAAATLPRGRCHAAR